ncbi:MAG TPA: SDR family oxidoreductase [Acidimicrobiia bacterium]
MNIVVFGASGYVGGRLIPVLLEQGHRVRAVTRSPASIADHRWIAQVEVTRADLLDEASVKTALDGMDAAYYLVHSMERADFEEADRRAAQVFSRCAAEAHVQRIMYLGGLGRGDLSPHLASRQEVGRILASGPVPVTEFRAAVIIGSGSLSFEMTRYLTEVLPVMVAPKWVATRCQPIAIRDVLSYLAGALSHPETAGRVIEIGGQDVLTYAEMMQRYARVAGLRRRVIVRVPLLSLGLSARWIGLVTPLSYKVAAHLIDSLRHEVVVTDDSADLIPVEPAGYDEAVMRALERTRGDDVPTRWGRGSWSPAEPLPSDPEHALGTLFRDRRVVDSKAGAEDVAWAFMRIGGTTGYYSADWAWRIRGMIDTIFGGAGLRRGRRHPQHVAVGEPLDFWRVVGVEPGRSLDLKAEMRVPGEAWLTWHVEALEGGGSRLTQVAWFVPRGLFGRLYWYVLVPFHALVFPRMARGVVAAAEHRADPDTRAGR